MSGILDARILPFRSSDESFPDSDIPCCNVGHDEHLPGWALHQAPAELQAPDHDVFPGGAQAIRQQVIHKVCPSGTRDIPNYNW